MRTASVHLVSAFALACGTAGPVLGHPGHDASADARAIAAMADALASFGIQPAAHPATQTALLAADQPRPRPTSSRQPPPPRERRRGTPDGETTESVEVRREPMEAIDLPPSSVSITIEGSERIIRANGLPAHDTGAFPNDGNPNAIRPQSFEFRLPLVPTLAARPREARPEFGVTLNGVIFDAGTGEFWAPGDARRFGGGSEWNYEALGGGVPLGLDHNNAHVQPTGKYHYHGVPTGLIESLAGPDGSKRPILIGWAFDGFPIYGPYGFSDAADDKSAAKALRPSYRLKRGTRPDSPEGPGGAYDGTFSADYEYVEGSGDLDECNGRFGVTQEFPMGTYYYVITEAYPNVPRMWRGQAAAGMQHGGTMEGHIEVTATPETTEDNDDRRRRPGPTHSPRRPRDPRR